MQKSTIHRKRFFKILRVMHHSLSLFFILFYFNDLSAKQIILSCLITDEIENNEPAKGKNYFNKKLIIYLDKKNSWINDIEKSLWIKEYKDDFERTEIRFLEDNKKINFQYELFFSPEKKNLELVSLITFEKFSGNLNFIKNYYNFKNEIFFVSEVQGKCSGK
mgnify:CR=1 FL=1